MREGKKRRETEWINEKEREEEEKRERKLIN